jgi:hypothetical protein
MFRNHRGDSVIIVLLILVAIIPISAYFFVRGRSGLATGNLDSIKNLPDKTLTSVLKEIVYYDEKLKKEIRYWAFVTTNHGSESLFNCYLILSPKGEKTRYFGFSKNYSLTDCNQFTDIRANYECRLGNAITKFKHAESSRIWDKIAAKGSLTVAVSRFYTDQTIPAHNFFTANRLSDIFTLTPICKTATGTKVKQVIPFN